jgi:hypothetical protein
MVKQNKIINKLNLLKKKNHAAEKIQAYKVIDEIHNGRLN